MKDKTVNIAVPKLILADIIESKIVGLIEELACLYGNKIGISYIPIQPKRQEYQGLEIQWKKFYKKESSK